MVNQGYYDLRHDVDRLQNKVNVFQNEFTNTYFIETSVPAIIYKDDTFNPESITFYSYGDIKGKISVYEGKLVILTSVNGEDYTTLTTATDSSITIHITDQTINFFKCELYNPDTNTLLDSQTVPILRDNDSESALSVFLGNESQLIPCGSDGKVESTINFTIPFYCYKGITMYPCIYQDDHTFTEEGFSIVINKQCSKTDHGLITVTATEGSTLTGLKHSIINMNFLVDDITVTKQFNWAKVIKGEPGDDGATPTLFVKYSKTPNPSSMDELVNIETEGYDYRGVAWVYDGKEPTTVDAYKPFVNYDPTDGIDGADGYVHIAYSSSEDGSKDFTTGKPTSIHHYMGTYTDHTKKDSTDYTVYKWAKIKGDPGEDGEDGDDGQDGQTPTPEIIIDIVDKTDINANTLNGNTSDNFVPSQLPTETIYRDDTDKTQNYIKLYKVGQLIICQLFKFNGNSSKYGQDPYETDYFKLMPDTKVIPTDWLPTNTLYMNDLNNADGSSNGRVRLNAKTGMITKLGKAGVTYNNTYATFIYPIVAKTDITLGCTISSTAVYGDKLSAVVSSNAGVIANLPVLFELSPSSTASQSFEYTAYTNSKGVASVSLTPTTGITYTVSVQCKGNNLYNPSNTVSGECSVNKTNATLSVSSKDRLVSGHISNDTGIALSSVVLTLDGRYTYYSDSTGQFSFYTTSGQHTLTVDSVYNPGITTISKTFTV